MIHDSQNDAAPNKLVELTVHYLTSGPQLEFMMDVIKNAVLFFSDRHCRCIHRLWRRVSRSQKCRLAVSFGPKVRRVLAACG
jgi:hypothetical protein